MALPNGRILGEVMPLLRQIGIEPEPAFDDPASRPLPFTTSEPGAPRGPTGLSATEPIAEVSSRRIVTRPARKPRPEEVGGWIERFRAAIGRKSPSPTQSFGLGPPSPAVRERAPTGAAGPPLS